MFRMIHESFQYLTLKKKALIEDLKRKRAEQAEMERIENERNKRSKLTNKP